MSLRTRHTVFPHSNARMRTLTRSFNGNGVGAVLLDGGVGTKSSYFGIDNYLETVNQPKPRGRGLSDKINHKLGKLNIAPPTSKPKVKNITLSI